MISHVHFEKKEAFFFQLWNFLSPFRLTKTTLKIRIRRNVIIGRTIVLLQRATAQTRRTPRALFTPQEIRRSILLVVRGKSRKSRGGETTRDFSKVCRSNYYFTSRTRLLTTSPLFNDRVIQALTANIDLSSLFADVLMNAATGDIATKKMLYHYIGVYSDKSKESEELAMMTINTLQKDTKHEDPTIRGLAIRSMTSLRSKSLVEYSIECVKEGLKDAHPYARKAACLGCLKVYRLCCASSSSL